MKMRKNIIRITTHDTKKTYEFPAKKEEENPRLWEVELRIGTVNSDGRTRYGFNTKCGIFLEGETLEFHGLKGEIKNEEGKVVKPPKTPEDLLLELLGTLGFYQTE